MEFPHLHAVVCYLFYSNIRVFQLKEFTDDNFKFNENGRKFSKQVDKTVGKGKIAHCKQFLFLPPCFQKTCPADMKKPGLVWEGLKENK